MSDDRYYAQIDGLRALCIAIVVASHTNALGMYGQGGLAVVFCFVISGFLLVNPGQTNGEKKIIGSVKSVLAYYIRKIIRLLIPYYIILLITIWLTGSYDGLFGNLTFTQSTGHFWFLQQEVVFCIISPIIIFFLFCLKQTCKFNDLMIAIVLFFLALLSKKYLSTNIFYLYGNGNKQQFELFIFLIGMAFGYLCRGGVKENSKPLINIICVIIFLFMFLSSAYFLSKFFNVNSAYFIGWQKPLLCSLIAGLFLVLIVIYPNCIINNILKSPVLVYLGKISYTIYLVHYSMLSYVAPLPSANKRFFAVYILGVGIAELMYQYIEKPFKMVSKKITGYLVSDDS